MCLRNNAKIISSGGDTSDQALSQAAPYAIAKLCYCNPLTLLSPTTANHHVMPTLITATSIHHCHHPGGGWVHQWLVAVIGSSS